MGEPTRFTASCYPAPSVEIMKIQWLFRIGLVACAIALGVLNLALWQQQGEVPSGDLASDNND